MYSLLPLRLVRGRGAEPGLTRAPRDRLLQPAVGALPWQGLHVFPSVRHGRELGLGEEEAEGSNGNNNQ